MGKRGPPKGSASARRCASNRRKPAAAPAQGHAPQKPGWLTGEAAAEWKRVVKQLVAAGGVETADRAMMAAYCQSWSEWVAATATLAEEGTTVTEPIQNAGGTVIGDRRKPHPAVALQREAYGRLKVFGDSFGMSPSSRSRISGDQAVAAAAIAQAAPNRLEGIKKRVDAARQKGGPDA